LGLLSEKERQKETKEEPQSLRDGDVIHPD